MSVVRSPWSVAKKRIEHSAEGKTAGRKQIAAGSRQKSEVRDQTSEVRGKADL